MKLLTKILLILIFSFSFFALRLSEAHAHVLQTDSSVGAVLHVNPEDDPIAGEPAGFFFEFKDTKGKFKPENCDCTFSILQAGKEIYSQPLFQNNTDPSLQNASLFFTFPEKDVYKIKVIGKPTQENAFEPFTLEYDIRVEKESAPQAKQEEKSWFAAHIGLLIAAFAAVVFVIIAFIKQKIKKGGKKND